MSESQVMLANLLRHIAQNSIRKGSTFSDGGETNLQKIEARHPSQVVTSLAPSGITNRTVLAGQLSDPIKYIGHFCDHGDGTVSDTRTGLMWKRAAEGQGWNGSSCTGEAIRIRLQDAIAIRSNFSGYNDWRLPTIEELQALVGTIGSGLDSVAFPNQSSRRFWSCSRKIPGDDKYDGHHFFDGYALVFTVGADTVGFSHPETALAHVLLMRDGLRFSIDVTTAGTGIGNVARSVDAVNYPFGSSVVLTACPAEGSAFSGWHGAASGTNDVCTVTLDSAKTISAEFTRLELFDLEVTPTGSGGGIITHSPEAKRHIQGSTVKLTARPVKGSKFVGWLGDASGRSATCTVSMDSAKKISAVFVKLENFALTVVSTGTGDGEITRSPDAQKYIDGTAVTLTARAKEGSKFKCWHGAMNGRAATCTVTMDLAKTLSAEFVQLESFALDVTATGTGSGRIMRNADAPTYFAGSTVTLTAKADEGSIFNGWHGDATGLDDVCTVTLNATASVSAEFEKTTISDTLISVEFKSIERINLTASRYGIAFYLTIRNSGVQPAQVKIPLTSYVNCNDQVSRQSTWDTKGVGLVNGSKGATLLPGTFAQIGLVYELFKLKKGDRLYVNVEQAKPLGRICFTFTCTDTDRRYDGTFMLINANLENPKEAEDSNKTLPGMASVLRRIESLEGTLAEVLRKLDAMQGGYVHSVANTPNRVVPSQTLPDVLAWLAEQGRIAVADLRARLLPLDLLPRSVIDDINQRALDLTGELALEEAGDEIVVAKELFDVVLARWDSSSV